MPSSLWSVFDAVTESTVVGRVPGKPHLRFAKDVHKKKEAVVLKFYWEKELFDNAESVHPKLLDSQHICR